MELSPKQQAIEKIKNSERVLILGHKNVSGDQLGSMLALNDVLVKLRKNIEIVVSENIPTKYSFLSNINSIKPNIENVEGKIIKLDTEKIPVSGMKWQKDEKYLRIILDTEKNIKFEHIDIINGQPKPDLIIIVDTEKTEEIDSAFNKNHELFLEVPIVNIDHHSNNENFGTINLVDQTATSTSEILVSLFEALGIKIDNQEIATHLLTGIIEDTKSFQNNNITPKSLTVAAQLLAAGAKQQEIIRNLFKNIETEGFKKNIVTKSNNDLMRLWNMMVENTQVDNQHSFGWLKINADKEDAFEAADELLEKNNNINTLLIICKDRGSIYGKITGNDAKGILEKCFSESYKSSEFNVETKNLDEAEKNILKKIFDYWQSSEDTKTDSKEIWEALNNNKEMEPNKDAIEEALRSIEQSQDEQEKQKELTSIREVIDRKKQTLNSREEIDVFEEQEE